MASMKLSFTFILLLSGAGLVVFFGEGADGKRTGAAAACGVQCFQGGYITCDNYPYQELDGCDCQCAPKNGKNCKLHLLSSGDTFDCPAHQEA